MRKIDDALLVVAQRAYLWLYDWTGVYVGTLLFLMAGVVGMQDAATGRFSVLTTLVLGIYGLIGWLRIRLQYTNEDAYNAVAEASTRSVERMIFTIAMAVMLVSEIATGQWSLIISSVAFICAFYLLTVKVRPREPKKFFEQQETTNEC